MAFNINAHVILSGPKNIKAVTKRIQRQLGSVNARINLVTPKGLSKQIGSFNKGLSRLNKSITTLQSSATTANAHLQKLGNQFRSLNKASSSMSKSQAGVQKSLANTGHQVKQVANEIQAFGKDAALAIRRFAAFTVATGVIFGFVRAIQSATKAAIDYEREIVKIVQVTGASADKIGKLNKTITQLSVSLGVDANELAELGRIFAQTGQTIDQVGDSIRAIARSSLAPSFGTMKSTAEGLIAAMAQFNIAASESEAVLASLNAVSKKWAVEAEDMISVIRRAGGVFAASAGQMDDPKKSLNELIGIFVAVRSTTRESADTIAVGLRTIFTRIQRRGTIEFLKQFNIELIDAKGNFIGLFPAFQELSRGLSDIIRKGDALTLSAITEELGGVRQVGKLIPAITQFNKALAATKVAGEAAAKGLGKDVALALQPLGKQFELLQQRFNALIRDITQSKTFQNMAKVALSMANAFLSVAETLKPLIPLMTTFAAIKISRGLFDFGTGFIGGVRKGGGVAGAGGALGGAVTGAASGGAAKSISAQQALTSAIKSHSTLLTSNNAALKQLGTQVIGNTTAINAAGGKVATSSTQIIGSMGNLINALNRASLGGGGGGIRGRKKFARGGYVSGPSHAQGGVPAILEGGEYVIPKTQYHAGGTGGRGVTGMSTKATLKNSGRFGPHRLIDETAFGAAILKGTGRHKKSQQETFTPAQVRAKDKKLHGKLAIESPLDTSKMGSAKTFAMKREGLSPSTFKKFDEALIAGIIEGINVAGRMVAASLQLPFPKGGVPKGDASSFLKSINRAVKGNLFENVLNAANTDGTFSGLGEANRPFDMEAGLTNILLDDWKELKDVMYLDAKASTSAASPRNLRSKALQTLVRELPRQPLGRAKGREIPKGKLGKELSTKEVKELAGLTGRPTQKDMLAALQNAGYSATSMGGNRGKWKIATLAAGGNVFAPRGTDTVPAMLTPGEFVINKKSAQSFGYGNLKKINSYSKGGVAATGNVQYLEDGTGKSSGPDKAMGLVFGIQMAVGALAGFTAALAGFDLNAPLTSIMALGMAAMQAAGSMALLAPGLSKTIMASKGVTKVMGKVKGQFANVTQPFTQAGRAAKGTFVSSRAGGSFGDKMAGKGFAPKSITKSLSAGSGKFFRSMGRSLPRLLKGVFTGIPGLITAFLIGPLSNAVADFFFGKKEEIAPGVKGRSGVGVGAAAGAGAGVGAVTGAATGAAIGSMILPGIGTAIGAVIGTLAGAVKGWWDSKAAQIEFLAFQELQENSKKLGESFKNLAKLGDSVDAGALAGINNEIGTVLSNISGAFEAGVDRRAGTIPGFLTSGGKADAIAEALQVAASQIGPETFQDMDNAIQGLVSRMASDLGAMGDEASLTSIASMETVSADPTDAAANARLLDASFNTLSTTLKSTETGTEGFAKQLDRLVAQSIKMHLIKDVADQLKILEQIDPDKSRQLATQFNELNKKVDFSTASVKQIDAAIVEVGRETGTSTKELNKLVQNRKAEAVVMAKQASTLELINMATRASRKALDALVAGLEQFGARTKGVAVQAALTADNLKASFADITGEATIGQFKQFNPFENLASATDTQIDASISKMKDFGGAGPEGDVAFKGIGEMLKAGRDFPLAMRNIVDQIDEQQVKGGKKLTNQEVVGMVETEFGGNLPENMLTSVTEALKAGADRQEGGAFSSDALKDMFKDNGKIAELLGKAFNTTVKEMAGFDDTVARMKNSLMEVARVQEQMAKHRLSAELAMLDKQEAIRSRIDSALGTSVGAFGQATKDLQKRVAIQLKGGLKPGEGVVGVPGGADVLDPKTLFDRLKTIDDKRAETRAKIGVGKPEDIAENTAIMGKLNREMEGTEAALRTLANDTRKLAAIESQIAAQQARGKGAEGTVDSILDGLNKLMTGELDPTKFSKQITKPLTTVNKVFDDTQAVTFPEGMDFVQRIQSGDKLTTGFAEKQMRERAKAAGVDVKDDTALKAFSKDFYKDLKINMAAKGTALGQKIGVPNLGEVIKGMMEEAFEAESEAEILGNEMRDVGAQQVSIMQKMLEREEALMATTLHNNNEEFNTAVNAFQDAVTEFALMRGGLSESDMASVADDVKKAEDEKTSAKVALDTAEKGQDAAVAAAGDAAADQARKDAEAVGLKANAPEGSAQQLERQNRIDTARADAESAAKRTTDQDIKQKKSTFDKASSKLESKKAFQKKMEGRFTTQEADKQKQADAAANAEAAAKAKEEQAKQKTEQVTQEVPPVPEEEKRGWGGFALDTAGRGLGLGLDSVSNVFDAWTNALQAVSGTVGGVASAGAGLIEAGGQKAGWWGQKDVEDKRVNTEQRIQGEVQQRALAIFKKEGKPAKTHVTATGKETEEFKAIKDKLRDDVEKDIAEKGEEAFSDPTMTLRESKGQDLMQMGSWGQLDTSRTIDPLAGKTPKQLERMRGTMYNPRGEKGFDETNVGFDASGRMFKQGWAAAKQSKEAVTNLATGGTSVASGSRDYVGEVINQNLKDMGASQGYGNTMKGLRFGLDMVSTGGAGAVTKAGVKTTTKAANVTRRMLQGRKMLKPVTDVAQKSIGKGRKFVSEGTEMLTRRAGTGGRASGGRLRAQKAVIAREGGVPMNMREAAELRRAEGIGLGPQRTVRSKRMGTVRKVRDDLPSAARFDSSQLIKKQAPTLRERAGSIALRGRNMIPSGVRETIGGTVRNVTQRIGKSKRVQRMKQQYAAGARRSMDLPTNQPYSKAATAEMWEQAGLRGRASGVMNVARNIPLVGKGVKGMERSAKFVGRHPVEAAMVGQGISVTRKLPNAFPKALGDRHEGSEDMSMPGEELAAGAAGTGAVDVPAGAAGTGAVDVPAGAAGTGAVDVPAGARVPDEAARVAVAGGCCSDIISRLDEIIALLGVGGPPSEAAAVMRKPAATKPAAAGEAKGAGAKSDVVTAEEAADVARRGDAEARVASEKPGGLGEGGKRYKPLTKKQKAAQTKTREAELEQAREKDEAAKLEFDQNMESQQEEIDIHRAEAEEWLNLSKYEQEQAKEKKYSIGGGMYAVDASPEKAKEYQANIDQNEKHRQERVDYWNEQQKKLDKTKERGAHAPEEQRTKDRHSQEDKLQRENVERQEKWDKMTPEERDESHTLRDSVLGLEPGTSKAAFEARQPADARAADGAAAAQVATDTQPGGPTQQELDNAKFAEYHAEGLEQLEGRDPLAEAAANRARKTKKEKSIDIGSSAGRRPGDTAGKLSDFRHAQAASTSPRRRGGARGAGGRIENMDNRRQAEIEKRDQRRLGRGADMSLYQIGSDGNVWGSGSADREERAAHRKKDRQNVENIQEKGLRDASGNRRMSGADQARYHRREVLDQSDKALNRAMDRVGGGNWIEKPGGNWEEQPGRIGVMKEALKKIDDKDSPRAKKIQANIDRANDKMVRLWDRTSMGQAEANPAKVAQEKQNEQAAALDNLPTQTTQEDEAANIETLTNAATSNGSLYTHDVHAEKLLQGILTILGGTAPGEQRTVDRALEYGDARRRVAGETLAQQHVVQDQGTTIGQDYQATQRPGTAKPKAGAGGAGGNLEELLKGKEFAQNVTDALFDGAKEVKRQIEAGFKGAIPEVIQMKAELGALTVKIVGGNVLEKWSEGVITRMEAKMVEAIRTEVIPSALNKAEGTNGQSSGGTGNSP